MERDYWQAGCRSGPGINFGKRLQTISQEFSGSIGKQRSDTKGIWDVTRIRAKQTSWYAIVWEPGYRCLSTRRNAIGARNRLGMPSKEPRATDFHARERGGRITEVPAWDVADRVDRRHWRRERVKTRSCLGVRERREYRSKTNVGCRGQEWVRVWAWFDLRRSSSTSDDTSFFGYVAKIRKVVKSAKHEVRLEVNSDQSFPTPVNMECLAFSCGGRHSRRGLGWYQWRFRNGGASRREQGR
ncbi:hypothetical protein OF83DRAFT_85168 [Amylostereum chailletii]|nr:hypothetical protein OF83DRAFT_85168 [Amylostereum chailletii]